MTNSIGLYLHVPFCKQKCAYCDFFSGRAGEADYDNYTRRLKEKIIYWGAQTTETVSSVYIGGGTPSVLGTKRLTELLSAVFAAFSVLPHAEVTVEINPESGKALEFSALKAIGVNRISVGLQSANAKELKTLGRIHTPHDAAITLQSAQRAGIENTSLDLMMGIPYQTTDSLRRSIDFCASCGVTHISSYILKIEEGTPFAAAKEKLPLPNDDEQAQLYLFAVDYLEKRGFRQYEISNFSVPGRESRHNTLYWQCGEYLGLGPSAYSFYHGRRFHYERDFQAFYENRITDDGAGGDEEEFIMLALRLKSGLDFAQYETKFQKHLSPAVMREIKRFESAGYMNTDGRRAWLTPRGCLVSNSIIAEILYHH